MYVVWIYRAVGTGPADPASTGPKFNRNPQSSLKFLLQFNTVMQSINH